MESSRRQWRAEPGQSIENNLKLGSRPTLRGNGLILKTAPGKGRGVFATRAFRASQELLVFEGNKVDRDFLEDLTYALQIGPRTFLTASGQIDDYVNHSCEPNTGVTEREGHIILFALRDIKRGEEITFDYSTTQSGGFCIMACSCGSGGCRGQVGDFEDLPDNVKSYYIKHQAVLPFLVNQAQTNR